jgi:hypothetical protein
MLRNEIAGLRERPADEARPLFDTRDEISGARTTDGAMVQPEQIMKNDEVIRLREWGTDQIHVLPQPPCQGWRIGTSPECRLQMADSRVSPIHADLTYQHGGWWIRTLGSARGIRQDGVSREEFVLVPGVEVGIGETTLIAESPRSIALRDFCARLLGWGGAHMSAVDHALRAIRLAGACRSLLILRGERDLVPIGYALHRHTLGVDAPFVVCDRRRQTVDASVRSQANHESGVAAFEAAAGGSLCMTARLPRDVTALLARLYEPDPRVQLIVCSNRNDRGVRLAGPVPICVPPLRERALELPRIVEEYAAEAIAALRPLRPWDSFTAADLQWVVACAATSLPEIEKATLRVVAIKMSANLSDAAGLLGMAPVSLARWLGRRSQPATANPGSRRC